MPFVGNDLVPVKLLRLLRNFLFKELGICQGRSHV